MTFWQWINNNAGGIGVILLAVSLLTGALSWLKPWSLFSKPDLLVTVGFTESTIPPDLLDWMQDLSVVLSRANKEGVWAREENSSENLLQLEARIQELGSSLNSRRLQGLQKISKVVMKFTNQTARNLENVRVRILSVNTNRGGFWINLNGDYLTPSEAEAFLQKIDWNQKGVVVLPPLPEIPPNATLKTTYYGPISVSAHRDLPKVEVSAGNLKSYVRWVAPELYFVMDSYESWRITLRAISFTGLVVLILVILLYVVGRVREAFTEESSLNGR